MSKQSLKNTNQLYLSFDALPKQSPPETVAFIRTARVTSKAKPAKTSLAACSSDQIASPAIVSSKPATTKPSPETVLLSEDQIAQIPYDASSLRFLGDSAALVQDAPGKVEGAPNAADALSARTLTDAPTASLARSGEGQSCRQVGAGPCISLSEPTRERANEMKIPSEQFEVARMNDTFLEDVGTLSVGAPANDDERRLDLFGKTRRAPTPGVGQLARALNEEPGRNDAAHGAVDLVSGDGSLLIPTAPNAELHADRRQIHAFAKASVKSAFAKAPAACTVIRNPCRSGDTLIEQHLAEISDGATIAGRPKNIFESDASGPAPLDGPYGPAPQKLERKPRYDADEFAKLAKVAAVIEGPDLGRSKGVMYLLAAQDIAHESAVGEGGSETGGYVPEGNFPMKYTKLTDLKSLVDDWLYWSLKKGSDLQEAYGLKLTQVAVMDFEELAEKYDEMGVKDPDKNARTLINTLHKISIEHPGVGIPELSKTRQLWNAAIPLREEPRQLRIDLARAYCKHKRENHSDILPDEERSLLTLFIHNRRTRTFMAALRRAPTVHHIGQTVGVEQMTHPKLATRAFDQMKKEGYSKTTISMVGYSVVAIFRNVLSEDHAHLSWLQSYLAAAHVYPAKALPFEKVHRIQQLLVNSGIALLMDAPQRIAARSNEATLDRKDRTARLAYAVAASLKMHHLAMSEKALTCFNLKTDIVTEDGQKFVIVTTLDGRQFRERITAETDGLIGQLMACRNETELSHDLLFPRRDELYPKKRSLKDAQPEDAPPQAKNRFRAVQPVMQGLYSEIRAATGISTTLAEIKDLMVEFLLEQGISPFIVAKRAGYANERSMRMRHQHLFNSGLTERRSPHGTVP